MLFAVESTGERRPAASATEYDVPETEKVAIDADVLA
jgi:hypothetical protein